MTILVEGSRPIAPSPERGAKAVRSRPPVLLWIAVACVLAFAASRVFLDPDRAIRRAEAAAATPSRAGPLAGLARDAIHASPVDGRGYRLLAESALASHDEAAAARLFALAVARGPRDLPSQVWLAHRALARNEFPAALARIDVILRVEPKLSPKLFPVMVAMAQSPAAQPALAAVLARRPSWRGVFLHNLIAAVPDSAGMYGLFDQLRHAPGGLAEEELGWWLDRLVMERRWGPAYISWAESLDSAARDHIGNVYDGGFETEPSGTGFDWRFGTVPGARITREQVTGATGGAALHVAFEDRRVPFEHVRQLLVLPPGHYRLVGRVRLDQLRSERGLVWTVACAEDARVIGEAGPFSGNRPWRDFAQDVEVPAVGCGAQWLVLRVPARIPAEQRIGGSAWFDGLELERVSEN